MSWSQVRNAVGTLVFAIFATPTLVFATLAVGFAGLAYLTARLAGINEDPDDHMVDGYE